MDTVTEDRMAIAMALGGGVGFIHSQCTVEEQVEMIQKVKRYENGFILDPAVFSPDNTIADLDYLKAQKKISGVPITSDGVMGSKLLGLCTRRDVDFIQNRNIKIQDVMTPIENLTTGLYPLSITEAFEILKESKKGYLPLIDENGCLRALTTRTDLKKNRDSPLATKDAQGRLVVGAAIPASVFSPNGKKRPIERDIERIQKLCLAEVDILLLDSLNGDNSRQLELLAYIKSNHPTVEVIAGNVVRPCQAIRLIEAGADGLRVGMGVGSISTTQISRAVGRPQLSTIYHCAQICRKYGVPVIADGGLKNTGTIIKALSLGANCAMMGSLLAGVEESPGEYFFQDGIQLKRYRSSSATAYAEETQNSKEKATLFTSGVTGCVADKGPLGRYLPFLCQSIRHGLQDMGVISVTKMHESMLSGELRFELRSASAQKEGGVHDLHSFTQKMFA